MNHVNSRLLLGLGAAALISLVAAMVISSGRKPVSGSTPATAYALPTLRDHINDVTAVTLRVAEDKPVVSLIKQDRGWVVKEKGDYPADTGKLRAMLLKLADAGLLEPKTSNEQRYAELGVEDVKSKEAKGVLVSLEGLGTSAHIIVGNVSARGEGTFVRRPDDEQSWLAKGMLTIDRDPAYWLDTGLVDIASDRIAEVVLTPSGGKRVRLFKDQPTAATFKLDPLPKGREVASEANLQGLASTLTGLVLLDVAQAQALKAPSDVHKARYRTFDGVTVDLSAWKQDGRHYGQFIAALDRTRADAYIRSEQAEARAAFEVQQKPGEGAEVQGRPAQQTAPLAVSDPVQARQQRLEQLTAEVDALNQRFSGRSFVIPPDKYSNMDKFWEDLLKPVSEASKAPAKPKTTKKSSGKR